MNRDLKGNIRTSERVDTAGKRGLVNGNGFTNGSGFIRDHGLTNGIGTRKGRTNGLVNGVGRVNGTGLTNGLASGLTNGMKKGSGLVNGRGLVNGTRVPLRRNLFGVVTHRDLRLGASLALLFILLLPPFYLLMSTPSYTGPVQIDGEFSDWANVPTYADATTSPNQNIAFTDYALTSDDSTLFVMLRVAGQIFPETQGYDGFFAFIDADANPKTGYWPGELGAEFEATVIGGGGRVERVELSQFNFAGDSLNWSAWEEISQMAAAYSGNSLEFAVPTREMNLHAGWALRLMGVDFQGNSVLSSVRVGSEFGALRAEQLPRTDYIPISPSSPEILDVRLHAYGKDIILDGLANRLTWQAYPSSMANAISVTNTVMIDADTDVTFSVNVDVSGMLSETALWLNLTNLVADVPVTIAGFGGVGYAKQIPQEKRVDGWFGDWQTGTLTDNLPTIADANVDVRAYGSNVSSSAGRDQAFLFVDFRGKAMGGSTVPIVVKWPQGQAVPSQPAPVPPGRRVAGEDLLIFYIDTNTNQSGGCPIADISANYKVEVIGHYGHVDSRTMYSCTGGTWARMTSAIVNAANSGSKIEASIDISLLGQLDNPAVAIQTTDWNHLGDVPKTIDLGTRSSSRSSGTRGSDAPRVLADPPGLQWMVSLPLSNEPTLDGECRAAEYSDAGHNVSIGFDWYVGHINGFVWVCVVFRDTTNTAGDYASLYVDSSHDGAVRPQPDDRNYTINASSTDLLKYRGTGTGWTNCTAFYCPFDQAQASFFQNFQNYEYRISQRNIWNQTSSTPGLSGFAIHMHNATGQTDYWWGSTAPNPLNPATWGHLEVPEFPAIIMSVVTIAALADIRRRRRRA